MSVGSGHLRTVPDWLTFGVCRFAGEPALVWPWAEPRNVSRLRFRNFPIEQDKFSNWQSTTTVKRVGLSGESARASRITDSRASRLEAPCRRAMDRSTRGQQ
jgi:hypothetical protein